MNAQVQKATMGVNGVKGGEGAFVWEDPLLIDQQLSEDERLIREFG